MDTSNSINHKIGYDFMTPRPYTDSILGPLTPWDTKVADLVCDTCGKKILPDIKLGDLHEAAAWWIEYARYNHFQKMMPPQMLDNKSEEENRKKSARFFTDVILQKNSDTTWHSQCTLKWVSIIEQKLKEKGIF
jgi:hypothetical protein